MIQNSVLRLHAVENGEIYGISDINFTIASFAANGRSQCGVVTPERVAKSKTSQWGLSKTREINFTIASFAANGRSQCGVVTPERVAMSKTSQWGLSKTRETNFTIASFAANSHAKHR